MNYSLPVFKWLAWIPALILVVGTAQAQIPATPFLALDPQALSAAHKTAADSLGADVQLVVLSTTGNDTSGLTGFKTKDGKSALWAYIYYSPSKGREVGVGVVNLFGAFTALGSSTDTSSALGSLGVLNTSAPYANSDKFALQLSSNSDFLKYSSDYPQSKPQSITMEPALALGSTLPSSFSPDMPVWMLVEGGSAGQDALICMTSAGTGETICTRQSASSGSVADTRANDATVGLSAAPNPANGRTRITGLGMDGIHIGTGSDIALYNTSGARVLDLTPEFAAHSYQFAEFDASSLPPGVYYCRANGAGWHGLVGVVIER